MKKLIVLIFLFVCSVADACVVSQHPNPNYRTYHLTQLVGEKDLLSKPNARGKDLISRSLKVRGVISVNTYPYSVSVRKGHAFSWEEVENGLKLILKECF